MIPAFAGMTTSLGIITIEEMKELQPLRIKINDIHPEGSEFHEKIPYEEVGLKKDDYIHFDAPLHIDVMCELFDEIVLAKVKVKSHFTTYCARTLVSVKKDWSQSFTLDFEIEKKAEYVDMWEDVRQEIVMALPVRVVTDEEAMKEFVFGKKEERPVEDDLEMKTYKPFEGLKLND